MTYPTSDKTSTLLSKLDISDWRVLELGPLNGRNTVPLAKAAGSLLAVDVRPENVDATRRAAKNAGLANVTVVLGDARRLPPTIGRFDLIFHSGVLYHLSDPAAHLLELPKFSSRLWLNTHYASRGSTRRSDCVCRGKRYEAYLRAENPAGRKAGVERSSRWLTRESLIACLADCGFSDQEIVAECIEPNGPRIAVWAQDHA